MAPEELNNEDTGIVDICRTANEHSYEMRNQALRKLQNNIEMLTEKSVLTRGSCFGNCEKSSMTRKGHITNPSQRP